MRWATRSGCHVDRAACAWLIRRFIDLEATFVFVDDPDDIPPDATGFDIRGVELTHHHGACSFETFLERYELTEGALSAMAQIVHEADLDDERFDAPEARGLNAIIRGMGSIYDDEELLAGSEPIFDGLYEHCRRGIVAIDEPETLRE
jgi:hypothetical protein